MESHSYWYIFTGVLMLIEAFTPRLFIFISIALASFITAVIDQTSNLNFWILLGIFAVVSILSLIIFRAFLVATVKIPTEKDEVKDFVGEEAMVFKAITPNEPGTIKLLDHEDVLLAKDVKGEFIGQGTSVRVVELNNKLALVETMMN